MLGLDSTLLPVLSLVLGLGLGNLGCGGSSTSPARDGSADVVATGGAGGSAVGGAGGNAGSAAGGGSAGGGAGGAAGGSTGGAGPAGGGQGGGGIDAAAGAGGTGAGGTDGGNAPVDMASDRPSFPFDAFPRDGLTLGDGGPMVILCPVDVTTATCTMGTICVRQGPSGPDGCGCTIGQRWFCPGIGADGGLGPLDSGVVPDVAGVPACAPGTASGVSCSPEGAVCAGAGSLGCACATAFGGLRWFCL